MNAIDIMLNFFHEDTLGAIATRRAATRFRYWGEISWVRAADDLTLPSDPSLVASIEYEAAGYEDDGALSHVGAFIATPFETLALIRMRGTKIRMTVWGEDREAVDATISAFLEAWPRRDEDDKSKAAEPVPGHYL